MSAAVKDAWIEQEEKMMRDEESDSYQYEDDAYDAMMDAYVDAYDAMMDAYVDAEYDKFESALVDLIAAHERWAVAGAADFNVSDGLQCFVKEQMGKYEYCLKTEEQLFQAVVNLCERYLLADELSGNALGVIKVICGAAKMHLMVEKVNR
jgi:hypothetical protein